MDMIVAAAAASATLRSTAPSFRAAKAGDKAAQDRFLNERLMNDLRPTCSWRSSRTCWPATSSIVHGVTGSSRTFMGEESPASTPCASRSPASRPARATSPCRRRPDAERKEMLMLYGFGGFALKDAFRPVWDRAEHPGFALGSMGAFLVPRRARTRRHAAPSAGTARRRCNARARTASRRRTATLARCGRRCRPVRPGQRRHHLRGDRRGGRDAEERAFLEARSALVVRATGTHIGHAWSRICHQHPRWRRWPVERGTLFPSRDPFERPMSGALIQAVVTGVGHWRGEGWRWWRQPDSFECGACSILLPPRLREAGWGSFHARRLLKRPHPALPKTGRDKRGGHITWLTCATRRDARSWW